MYIRYMYITSLLRPLPHHYPAPVGHHIFKGDTLRGMYNNQAGSFFNLIDLCFL